MRTVKYLCACKRATTFRFPTSFVPFRRWWLTCQHCRR